MPGRFAVLTIRNGVTACLMIAAASLLSVGAIGPLHAMSLAGAILFGRRAGRPRLPSRTWDLLALGALLLFPFDLFLLSRNLIGAALRLLTFVVVYRCANLNEHRDLRQAVSLSFVQMLAAAASTTEAYVAFFLAAYLAMAVWTLMAMASARDDAPAAARRAPSGGPVAFVTFATLALGAALFFVIPHLGTGYFQPASILRRGGDGLSGFADRIELGSIGRIKKNRSIVMRARLIGVSDPASRPVRWRGVALDTFDGRSWSASDAARTWVDRGRDGSIAVSPTVKGQPVLEQEISMLPLMVPVLFASPGPTRIISDSITTLGVDSGGALYLPSPRYARFTYRVISAAPETALNGYGLPPGSAVRQARSSPADVSEPIEMARYLTLPRLDPRVATLARAVTARATSDFERARLLEDYLRANHAYSLDVNDAGVADPVTHFLLERNPGHCEYFATALALMLRHLGIPSRVVNGFTSGDWSNLTGSFVVRGSDAHAWVEAWLPERGWVTLDPTPSQAEVVSRGGLLARMWRMTDRIELAWDTWIIGLDLLDQQSFAASMMDAMAVLAEAGGRMTASLHDAVASAVAAGWERAGMTGAAGAAVTIVLLVLGARRCRPWIASRWHWLMTPRGGRRGPAGYSSAAAAFKRFEARWAARGVLRAPGQTPLEFAREIERRALDEPGAALRFIEIYYRARFGA